jgi:hypothetical protein
VGDVDRNLRRNFMSPAGTALAGREDQGRFVGLDFSVASDAARGNAGSSRTSMRATREVAE